jgi:arylsulfatase A-like enzyme
MRLRFALVPAAVCVLLLAPLLALSAEGPRKPNVLFIAVDDLRPDLGCYGNGEVKSPHIDALAKSSVLFRRAYCQQAVCSPSRTSLLTGLRPDSTKVYDLVTHFRDTIPAVVTLPQHFKTNGYYTVGMGKIYHGGLDDAKSWSEPHINGQGQGYVLPENQARMAAGRKQAKAAGKKGKALTRSARGAPFEMAAVPDNAYTDGSLAEMAVEQLQKLKDKPFFLAVGFVKPHLPFNAPKKYWDLYDRAKLELADNPFRPKDAPPYAVTDFGELRNYWGVPQSGPVPDDMARELIHGYRAATSFTDANVGLVLAELERLGLRENTIVVLWGDHGWKLGEHAAWCKHSNMENDTNVVMLVSAPGAKANGQQSSGLVEFVDIYPTLCELAGLSLPKHLEGTSLKPLLDNPSRHWKTGAISQYPRTDKGQPLMGYSLRTDRYRLTEWRNRKTGAAVAYELYDHQTDPEENQSLAHMPEHAELVKKLAAQLKGGWEGNRPQ